MRKYAALLIITILFLGASLILPDLYVKKIPVVETQIITPTLVRTTIKCTGRVEERNKSEVIFDKPFVPAYINVKVGDSIKKGDLLMTVDKEATRQAYMESKNAVEVFGNNANFQFGNLTGDELIKHLDLPEEIRSTIDGVVTSVDAEEGVLSRSELPLVTVSDLSKLQVKVPVNESQISDVKVGQKVTITGVGFKNVKLTGTVDSIGLVAKTPPTGTNLEAYVEVFVTFDCNNGTVKPGFTAKAEIEIDKTPNVLIVPYTAVQQDEDGQQYVYLYKNGKAVRQYLTLGKELEQGYEVLDGIEREDKVITHADNISRNNSRVILAKKAGKDK